MAREVLETLVGTRTRRQLRQPHELVPWRMVRGTTVKRGFRCAHPDRQDEHQYRVQSHVKNVVSQWSDLTLSLVT